MRFVGSRHEQGAAYMAFGYARSTAGRASTPSFPDLACSIRRRRSATAYATNAPVLCLTGQIPSDGIGRGIGFLHELPDQLATMRSR